MKRKGLSSRSKAIYAVYGVLGAVSVAFVLALLISLGGFYIAGWDIEPDAEVTGPLVGWCLYAVVLLLALRIAVAWSVRRDRAQR